MNKPSQKSAPYITALHSAICIQCDRGLSRRLLFIKAVTRPALARPIQMATYSGLLSNNRATVSPGRKPASSKTWATLLLKSSIYRATENEISGISKTWVRSHLFKCPLSSFKNESYFIGVSFNIRFKDCWDSPIFLLETSHSQQNLKVSWQATETNR